MDDPGLIDAISRAQALVANDDRDGARVLYESLWDSAARAEDQYRACVVAHFMAHAHIEPETQLVWHMRALQAADAVGDERVRGFYPSLYANLGETCLRLGDLTRARQYAELARAAEHVLPDDFYGRMIRSLIARIKEEAWRR